MSKDNSAALPDTQTAYQNLFLGVQSQVFFNKCAQYGYVPQNEAEAQMMLETAAKLRVIAEDNRVKQAGAQDNLFYRLNSNLDKVAAEYGFATTKQASHAEVEMSFKQAAAEVMQDPVIYNSVLALKMAEAAQIRDSFTAQKAGRA